MKSEDIQNRDFLVGMRGYDRDDVRSFLAEVAADHAALQAELEARVLPSIEAPAPPARDDFENLGAGVAAILRAAKESATDVTDEADVRALELREAADTYAASLRQQADELRAAAQGTAAETKQRAAQQADELRAAAQASLDGAHAEAESILLDATERARSIEIETEARLRNKVEAIITDADSRISAARELESILRDRLQQANEELQLALMALGESADVETVIAELRVEGGVDTTAAVDTPAWS